MSTTLREQPEWSPCTLTCELNQDHIRSSCNPQTREGDRLKFLFVLLPRQSQVGFEFHLAVCIAVIGILSAARCKVGAETDMNNTATIKT